MRILEWLFGKGKERPVGAANGEGSTNVAFVLLREPRLPETGEILSSFQAFAGPGEELRTDGGRNQGQIVSIDFNTGETAFIVLMPVPVPNGEADHAAQFSLSSIGTDWTLPPHCAHLVVTLRAKAEPSAVVLSRFTSLLAAITQCSSAVGVYWGGAGATHSPGFFLSVASDAELVPKLMLWSGVSVGREEDGRISLLSLGMKQLNLPDLLLIADSSSVGTAMETMFDFLAYVVERGEALAEGDTIGRTAEERLPVRYVPSPADPATRVCRLELL